MKQLVDSTLAFAACTLSQDLQNIQYTHIPEDNDATKLWVSLAISIAAPIIKEVLWELVKRWKNRKE